MKKRLFSLFFGIFLGMGFAFFLNFSQERLENFFTAQISQPIEEIGTVKTKRTKKPPLELEVKSALSLRLNPQKKIKERVLFAKNESEILPIASLTKLMTALIVIENPEDYPLDKVITISKEAASQPDVPEYRTLKFGEKKTIKELLNLMLYFSSNDAAFTLAEQIKIENFIDKMNEKAKELGLENTHFVNPTGLDPENLKWGLENKDFFNYSTAKDLVLLGKYILENYPLIFEFSNQKNKIQLLEGQYLVGMKTGYTDEAGGCLFLIFSEEDGDYFFNVILGAKSQEERFFQMQKLIDWINFY
jgi:D-alanyl-D-alanine carboxypeptidase (penicillin-binding protein 5/6)